MLFAGMAFQKHALKLLDQRALPAQEIWVELTSGEQVAQAIESMVVRGAPAIASAALFGIALEVNAVAVAHPKTEWWGFQSRFSELLGRFRKTRPTAVNLFAVLTHLDQQSQNYAPCKPIMDLAHEIQTYAESYFASDLARNQAIGSCGADYISLHSDVRGSRNVRSRGEMFSLSLMTHCNTGSLATGGYGTALGVIRTLHHRNKIKIVYVNETRPWHQGSRLTAYELKREGIPYRLLVDSAAAFVMQREGVDAVIVGADRIAANGDTANKIGTYHVAVAAAFHGVDFYVAASLDTIDVSISSGGSIEIEERSGDEVRKSGDRLLAPSDADVWNPSFDITPANLIGGFITEGGVILPPYDFSRGYQFA
jgi:methylthioribose-1-phosphate isomerase